MMHPLRDITYTVDVPDCSTAAPPVISSGLIGWGIAAVFIIVIVAIIATALVRANNSDNRRAMEQERIRSSRTCVTCGASTTGVK